MRSHHLMSQRCALEFSTRLVIDAFKIETEQVNPSIKRLVERFELSAEECPLNWRLRSVRFCPPQWRRPLHSPPSQAPRFTSCAIDSAFCRRHYIYLSFYCV